VAVRTGVLRRRLAAGGRHTLDAGSRAVRESSAAERIALVATFLTPFALVLDYRFGFGLWNETVTFTSRAYDVDLTYVERIGATHVVWILAGIAALARSRTRAGFRTQTTILLVAFLATLIAVTMLNGGLDRFAVHALLSTVVPLVAIAGVLLHHEVGITTIRRLVLVLSLLTAVIVLATLARNVYTTVTTEGGAEPLETNLLLNPSFEVDAGAWTPFGPPGTRVSFDVTRDGATDGARALLVSGRNDGAERRSFYAYSTPVTVAPGGLYFVQASVTAPDAGDATSLRLGVRLEDGSITSAPFEAREARLAVRPEGSGGSLQGFVRIPAGDGGSDVSLAVWLEGVAPGERFAFTVDGGRLSPTTPEVGRTIGGRFDIASFCCGATNTGVGLASLVLLLPILARTLVPALLLGGVLAAGLLLTETRGALLGAIAGALVYAARFRRLRWWIAGAAAFGAVFFAVASDRSITTLADPSNAVRREQVAAHFDLFLDRPWGYGMSETSADAFRAADNTLLGISNAGGVLALVLWLLAFGLPLVRALRRRPWSLPAVAALSVAVMTVIFWVTTGTEVLIAYPPTNLLPLVLAVALAGVAARDRPPPASSTAAPPHAGRGRLASWRARAARYAPRRSRSRSHAATTSSSASATTPSRTSAS
jgi:hypothetical protein